MDQEIVLSLTKCLDCRQGKENVMEENQSQEAPERLDYAPPAAITNDQPEPGPILRTCRACEKPKPKAGFYLNGAGKPDTVCKECRNQVRKDKYKEERARKKAPLKKAPSVSSPEPKKSSPLARQVGGAHYKSLPMQPVEFITRNKLGFLEGCIIKRLCRYNMPGGKGKQDLEKIMHECELLMEMEG